MDITKVYNQSGREVGTAELDPAVFGVALKNELVQQAVRTQLANRREVIANTKDRSEVRGGGRKPWRQKGTGRARHGSIRSPIWIGGGVTFGPRRDKNYHLKMNRRAKRKALLMALSERAMSGKLVVLDELKLVEAKTKALVAILKQLPLDKTVLLILPKRDELVIRAAHNIPGVTTIQADSLNIVDILAHRFLLCPKRALGIIAKTYSV